MPLFGLGCAAGAAGVGRAARLSARCARRRRGPGVGRALLADVPDGQADGVGSGRDRACSVMGRPRWWPSVIVVPNRPAVPAGPTSSIRAAASTRNRCTSWRWNVSSAGLQPVMSPELTDVIERHLADDVSRFLTATRSDQGRHRSVGQPIPVARKSSTRSAKTLELPPGGARADLALAGRDRQPLVGLGAAHPARHHRQTAAQRQPRADDRDGSGILLRTRATALALSRQLLRLLRLQQLPELNQVGIATGRQPARYISAAQLECGVNRSDPGHDGLTPRRPQRPPVKAQRLLWPPREQTRSVRA